MISVTTRCPWYVTLMIVLALALGSASCGTSSNPPTNTDIADTSLPDIIDDAEVTVPDQIDPDADTVEIPDDGGEELPAPDVPPECPGTKCVIGTLSCPTDDYEQICVAFDEAVCPDVGKWAEAVDCGEGSSCVDNEGCTCDMGTCTEMDLDACLSPDGLEQCEEWSCGGKSGCCIIEQIADCCTKAKDCDDDNPCTQNLCDMENHVCVFTSKVDQGLCDDGDPCTIDGCDIETGDCTNVLDTSIQECAPFCWGSDQEEANTDHCAFDPCAEPNCYYENGHLAWNQAFSPDCDTQPEYCGVCLFDTPKDCDDGDPCTIDDCDPGVGCVHEPDINNPACWCFNTDDCLPLIDGPCQEVICSVVDHICVKSPKDCDDGAFCTFDYCDMDQNKCLHQLVDIVEYPECADFTACYDQEMCDAELVETFGEDCPCKSTFCQPVTGTGYGICVFKDVGCDNANPCTTDSCDYDGETCACVHVDIDCDEGDPCTEDSCDPLAGCLHVPLDVDDGNKCTIDTCDPEAMLTDYAVHTPVVCEEKNCFVGVCNLGTGLCNYTSLSCEETPPDKCTDDVCDPGTGQCIHTQKVCDDYNPCTIDFCNVDGDCDGQPVNCDDLNPYTDDVCNEVTGECKNSPIYCNDYDFCTLDSWSPTIGCTYEPKDCTDCIHPLTGETEECPGGNGSPGFEINNCTSDLCDPLSGCYHVPINNPAAGCGGCLTDEFELDHDLCSDGNNCTEDQCICTAWNPANPTECAEAQCDSTPKVCECPGECAVCTCDPFSGMCDTVPGNCADCIDIESGDTVLCPGVVPDGYVKNLCTLDACDMETGECIHTEVVCFDNNLCTTDICNPVAGCTFPPVDCDDGKPCTIDSCQPGSGCLHVEDCHDDDLCTVDSCMDEEPFECQFLAVECNDENPCTEDICDGGGVCIFEPIPCDDGNPCTLDVCDPVLGDPEEDYCIFTPKVCDDGNPCTVDICHPLNGSCYFQEISCDDCIDPVTLDEVECPGTPPEGYVKNICTDDFAELSGDECVCNHTPVNPADQSFCTTDYCDPEVGIVNEELVCEDDGDPCTIETCNPNSGLCSSTLIQCEDDGDPCTEDEPESLEDPELGLICVCVSKPLECDDNNACTIDTTVVESGVCSCAHEDVICEDDEDPCTTDICKIDEGCVHVPPECEDGDVCTYDWCDPALAEISADPDIYCVHDLKTCQDCINPETGDVIQNCIELPEGYVYNECTQGDYCDLELGGCQYPDVMDCPSDGDLCTLEYCDPTTGQCASDPMDCDDGNVCTVDTCVDGQCIKSDAPGAQCITPDDCDDSDPCTLDICATTGDCTCSNAPVNCDDDDCCTVDTCDPDVGACVHSLVFPGCQVCTEDLDCLVECPINPFTQVQVEPDDEESGLCDPNTAVIIDDDNTVVVFRDACNHWLCNLDSGQGCDEGTGQCVNIAVQCDDGDDCTLDFCAPETGCFTEPNPACCTPETDPPLMDQDPDWNPQTSVCWDDDPCTVDSCNYETGACLYVALQCDDGNVCTTDVCEAGEGCTFSWTQGCEYTCYNDYDCAAAAGNPGDVLGLCSVNLCTFAVDPLGVCLYDTLVCGGGPPCTEGICDSTGGCSYRPLGAACDVVCDIDEDCDDGWACSDGVCNDGICLVTIKVCDDEDPCTRSFCDPATGYCATANLDVCEPDCVTQGGDAWCDDDDACTIDWCDETLHQCMYAFKTCEDGDLCTTDICDPDSGCLFFSSPPCLACYGDGDCDDGNPCTADICKNANPIQETDPNYMNDGAAHPVRYCAHESVCSQCVTQFDCDAYKLEHPCVESAVCDTDTGYCDITFTICDDGDACTLDGCNPFTGECMTTEIPDCCNIDSDCGLAPSCYASYCDPASHTCMSLPTLCDDFDPCTADSCDAGLGCIHTPIDECENQCEKPQDCYLIAYGPVSCTIADCVIDGESGMGTCAGTPLACDDGNPCTVDACVPLLGCQYYLTDPQCTFECVIDLDCDDGNPCTTESCNGQSQCDYSLVTCDDLDECTVDWCDLDTGACAYVECPDCICFEGCTQNSACDDGNPCTLDICDEGVCYHPTMGCFDGDPCTDDTCDPVGGCMFLPLPDCVGCTSGPSCDDGNLCTANACVNQYCVSQDLCSQ